MQRLNINCLNCDVSISQFKLKKIQKMAKAKKNAENQNPNVENQQPINQSDIEAQSPPANNQAGTQGAEQPADGKPQDTEVAQAAIEETAANEPTDGTDNGEQPNNPQDSEMDSENETGTVETEKSEISDKIRKIADGVFAQYTQVDELYFTSDLIPFFTKTNALAHAKSLRLMGVITVTKI